MRKMPRESSDELSELPHELQERSELREECELPNEERELLPELHEEREPPDEEREDEPDERELLEWEELL